MPKSIEQLEQEIHALELCISQDGYKSYTYACNGKRARFELGEKAISESVLYSNWYTFDVLHYLRDEPLVSPSEWKEEFEKVTGYEPTKID